MGWEDPLEKGMATHSSILAWRISWTEEPGGLQSIDYHNPTLILGGGQRDALVDLTSRTQAVKLWGAELAASPLSSHWGLTHSGCSQLGIVEPKNRAMVAWRRDSIIGNLFSKINLFFNWSMIVLQNFIFCQTSTRISHRYACIPSFLNLPTICLPITPFCIITESLFEFLESCRKFTLTIYFTYGLGSFHVTLSIHLNLSSPLPMSISLFSMAVSPLLPYK